MICYRTQLASVLCVLSTLGWSKVKPVGSNYRVGTITMNFRSPREMLNVRNQVICVAEAGRLPLALYNLKYGDVALATWASAGRLDVQ